MKHLTIFCIIIGMALLLVLQPGSATARNHALLIAIQDYSYYGDDVLFPSLKGALNDLILVRNVLQERFGFQDDDFTIIVDDEATHTGIEQAFTQLIERVSPGDFVCIHYSGHGSQTADLNGDEPAGQDQTWVPYGARTQNPVEHDNYDVLDDEVNAWLAALYEKTDQVVFVSDSCHSATVSRGNPIISRAVQADARPHPLGKQQFPRLDEHSGIRIGAARDPESAIEMVAEDAKYYGLFTWYWTRSLQHASPSETWNDVFKRAYTRVTALRGEVQQPQLEGARNLQIGGDFTPMPLTVPVISVSTDNVTIQAGSLSGITVDSVYQLYQPDHPAPNELPTLKITDVSPFTSVGKAQGMFHIGELVVEQSHVYHFPPIPVYLAADFPDTEDRSLLHVLRPRFHKTLGESSDLAAYVLTDDPQQAEIHLYLLRPKKEHGQYIYAPNDVLPQSFPDQSPEIWVLSSEHRLLYQNLRIPLNEAAPNQGLSLLQENLKKYARIREFKALSSPSDSKPEVAVEVTQLSPTASCQDRPDCISVPDLGCYCPTGTYQFQELDGRTLPQNTILTFALHNTSEEDSYYYLLDIGPDGKISAIFPALYQNIDVARVHSEERRQFPHGLLTETQGQETLKLIVSQQPIDISLIEVNGFQTRGGYKGHFNPLEQLVVNALYGQRSSTPTQHHEWATIQVSFEVQ